MALASAGWYVNVNFTETSGKSVSRRYKTTATTDAGAATIASDLVGNLALLTDSVINNYQIEHVFNDTQALPSAAENSNQALFTGKLTGKPNQSGTLSVPAAKADIFSAPTGAGYDVVDMTNTDVDDFIGSFQPAGSLLISDGDTLVAATVGGRRRNVHSLGT